MIKNPCSKEVKYGQFYYLEKSGKEFHMSDSIGTIYLKEPGKYKVIASFDGISQEVILKRGTNIDTLYTKKIYECYEPVSNPSFSGYCCCDNKCDGIQKDYYNDGTLRIEGNFKDGNAIGKVKLYHRNGMIKEIRIYNKKGILRRTKKYDLNRKRK